MQLTRFDRWLRETFVYEIHIQTLRPADGIPKGVRKVEVPDVPGKRYKHLYVAKSSKAADALILQLKNASQMYTTQIVDRKVWYAPFLAPKDKSVSWWLFSFVLISISVISALLYLRTFVEDPEFRKHFNEALKILKG